MADLAISMPPTDIASMARREQLIGKKGLCDTLTSDPGWFRSRLADVIAEIETRNPHNA